MLVLKVTTRKEYFHQWYLKNAEKKKAESKEDYHNHPEKYKKRMAEYYQRHKKERIEKSRQIRWKNKLKVIQHYGGKCVCCGEKEPKFLTMDHIYGGGLKHLRKVGFGTAFYLWIIRNNYPKNLQVLCFNCNMAKGHFRVCPHQEYMENRK